MLNPIALIASGCLPKLPAIEDVLVLPSDGPWTLLALALTDTDAERYADISQQDATWLSRALARQHSALAEISVSVTVYPLQFGLIVPKTEETLNAARQHHEELLRYFSLVAGASEWGLKAVLTESANEPSAETTGMSGLAWLKAKQSEPERRRLRMESALLRINEAVVPLLKQARAHTEVHRQAVIPNQHQQLLNLAVLVENIYSTAFLQDFELARAALSAEGIALNCSGPWPPYSFRPRLSE